MRPYKATATPPFEDRERWCALYHLNGEWHSVNDRDGSPIIYKTASAAVLAARCERERCLHEQET